MRVFIPVAPRRHGLAEVTVRQLLKYFPECSVTIITNAEGVSRLEPRVGNTVTFIDESVGIDGLSIQSLREAMPASAKGRAGWYFQQFVKYQVSQLVTEPFYSVIDGDTLLLRKLPLFDPQDPTFIVKSEFHKPYFDSIEHLLGLQKTVPHSYISECMLFRTDIVAELVGLLGSPDAAPWWRRVLSIIPVEHLVGAGFSEYETYGTYANARHPGLYRPISLRVLRSSELSFGERPSSKDLEFLGQDFDVATFERHKEISPMKILFNKFMARWNLSKRPSSPVLPRRD